jgi:hypothetical protein
MKNKNVHLLPTDKPSRLYKHNELGFKLLTPVKHEIGQYKGSNQNIYITSNEKPKEGDCVLENTTNKEPYIGKCFYPKNDGTVTEKVLKRDLLSVRYEGHYAMLVRVHNCKKIILTTDKDLINDGVQAIDDKFLEWFVKNPSCEYIKINDLYSYTNENTEHVGYKIIIPQEEPKLDTVGKQFYETADMTITVKRQEEPKQEN